MSSSWLLETRPIGDCMAVEISGAGLRCWMEGYDGGSGAAAAAVLLLLLLPVLHEMEGYGSSTEIEAVRELGLLDSAVP